MTLEDLIQRLDIDTIIRVVNVHTVFYGSVSEYKDIVLAKRYVRAIFHYPNELLITLEATSRE